MVVNRALSEDSGIRDAEAQARNNGQTGQARFATNGQEGRKAPERYMMDKQAQEAQWTPPDTLDANAPKVVKAVNRLTDSLLYAQAASFYLSDEADRCLNLGNTDSFDHWVAVFDSVQEVRERISAIIHAMLTDGTDLDLR